MKKNILILGAGLAGLTTAYHLKKAGISSTILEARNRVGGRMLTTSNNTHAPLEMGATWLGKKHRYLMQLLQELELDIYKQYMGDFAFYEPFSLSQPQLVALPKSSDESYKIAGGSSKLINRLVEELEQGQIKLDRAVKSIRFEKDVFYVKTDSEEFQADQVIITLPPNLLVRSISFSPQLPSLFMETAKATHTWMGDSIKIGISYARPFWNDANSSGTIVSNVGPIPEMYDHSDAGNNHFALIGFLNGNFFSVTKEERKRMIIKQLTKYYGEQAKTFLSYEEVVWRNEPFTFVSHDKHILPHQNNGNVLFEENYFNGKFFIAGSETAPSFPGYMDGAVESGFRVSQRILENRNG